MKKLTYLLLTFFVAIPVFGQSADTLDDVLARVIATEFPTWGQRVPGAPFHGNYATTPDKHMRGEWVKGKEKFLSTSVSIVDSSEELEKDRSHFFMRQIMPKSSPVVGLGDGAVLLSMCTGVDIMFARQNLLVKMSYRFRRGCDRRPDWEVTAPKKEIETATRLARSLYAAMTVPRSMTSCDNDLLNPVYPRPVDGREKMLAAARYGSESLIRSLLSAGSSISVSDTEGNTPLHLAVYHGCSEVIRSIIDAKVDVNARNFRQATPLMIATNFGHIDAVRMLLNAGADLNAKDMYGLNAASYAATGPSFSTLFPATDENRLAVRNFLKDLGLQPTKAKIPGFED